VGAKRVGGALRRDYYYHAERLLARSSRLQSQLFLRRRKAENLQPALEKRCRFRLSENHRLIKHGSPFSSRRRFATRARFYGGFRAGVPIDLSISRSKARFCAFRLPLPGRAPRARARTPSRAATAANAAGWIPFPIRRSRAFAAATEPRATATSSASPATHRFRSGAPSRASSSRPGGSCLPLRSTRTHPPTIQTRRRKGTRRPPRNVRAPAGDARRAPAEVARARPSAEAEASPARDVAPRPSRSARAVSRPRLRTSDRTRARSRTRPEPPRARRVLARAAQARVRDAFRTARRRVRGPPPRTPHPGRRPRRRPAGRTDSRWPASTSSWRHADARRALRQTTTSCGPTSRKSFNSFSFGKVLSGCVATAFFSVISNRAR